MLKRGLWAATREKERERSEKTRQGMKREELFECIA